VRRLQIARIALAGVWLPACHPTHVAADGAAATPTAGSTVAALSPSPASTSSSVASVSSSACASSSASALGVSAPQPPAPSPSQPDPFGSRSTFAPYACPNLHRGGSQRQYLAASDTSVAFVDGNDWLALVNRSPTGALAPDYAPDDLVDVKDLRARTPAECGSQRECLRHDAAVALREMLEAMRRDGLEGVVQSAFRAFGTQCWVFESWAHQARGGFCEATEQSALPGHSQHQLGTTLDLFTRNWAAEGARTGQGVFRSGFGCTQGGRWLDDEGWRFGFVVPYSIHPDDRADGSRCSTRTDRPVPIDPRTGYKSEPWHVRFVGREAAARYHSAWLTSGPGTPDEITLEQWIRAQRGLAGDTEVPVCDGCQCGACATLAADDSRAPCGKASLTLDDVGRVLSPAEPPRLVDAHVADPSARVPAGRSSRPVRHPDAERAPPGHKLVVLEADVAAPAHTPTQPPVFGRDGPTYTADSTYLSLIPYPETEPHRYPDLPGAWRIAIEPLPSTGSGAGSSATSSRTDPTSATPTPTRAQWPWRASLASPALEETWNRANVVLPAAAGNTKIRISVTIPESTPRVLVTLLRDGIEHDTREVALP